MNRYEKCGLTVINSHPSSNDRYRLMMERGLQLLAAGIFKMDRVVTHKVPLPEIPALPDLSHQAGFVKGVVVM